MRKKDNSYGKGRNNSLPTSLSTADYGMMLVSRGLNKRNSIRRKQTAKQFTL